MSKELLKLDTLLPSGHMYTKQCIEEALKTSMVEYGLVDGITHSVDLGKVVAKVENLRIEGDSLVGDITFLSTPMGLVSEHLDDQVEYSVVGTGNVDKSGMVSNYSMCYVNITAKEANG